GGSTTELSATGACATGAVPVKPLYGVPYTHSPALKDVQANVRFGSKADICGALADVRYGPSARPRIVGGTFTPIAGDTKRPPSLGEPSSKADVRAKTTIG